MDESMDTETGDEQCTTGSPTNTFDKVCSPGALTEDMRSVDEVTDSTKQNNNKEEKIIDLTDDDASTTASSKQTTPVKGDRQGIDEGTTGATPESAADVTSMASFTPLTSGSDTKKRRGRKRGEGEESLVDDDDLLSDDADDSNPLIIDRQEEDRLLQEPIDHEVEATDLDTSQVDAEDSLNASHNNDETQPRRGRLIKKPKQFSPDLDYSTEPKKKIPRSYKKKSRLSLTTASGPIITDEESVKKREHIDPKWLIPFEHGWKREIVFRNTYQEKKSRPADVYYYAPSGNKLRSGPEIQRKLQETNSEVTIDCFTFVKEPIHDPPMEVVRFAGRGFGRPPKNGSPSKTAGSPKTPKSPIMKKKQNPFGKSPLSLKKAAIATALPTSPKSAGAPPTKLTPRIIIKPVVKDPQVSSSSVTIRKSPSPALETYVNTLTPDGKTVFLKVTTPETMKVKKTVNPTFVLAKKRPRTPVEDLGDSLVNIAKKYKADEPKPRSSSGNVPSQRLCGMDCPGRQGIPPSLHCNVCMCMFHPECVGKAGYQRMDGFVCKSCKVMNKKLGNFSQPTPPPLHMTAQTNPGLCVGLPHLKPAPTLPPSGGIRAPPPLRMAPGGPSAPPPRVIRGSSMAPSNSFSTAQPISILPNMNVLSQTVSSNIIGMPPAMNMPPIMSMAPPPPVPVPAPPAPISISMPVSVPKDVNGQILALPNNVTNRLNLTKPISLKVNGQRFVIPPNCFVNTSEGAKVYLPQGYLPGNMTQGTTSPLSVNLTKTNDVDGQILDVSEYQDKVTNGIDASDAAIVTMQEKSLAKPRRSKRKYKGIDPLQCFIQPLHVGYDCMLHIFQYLTLEDILRASQVCRTWRRVAEQHCLWRKVELRGCRIHNWEKVATKLRQMNTHTLDLRGLQHLDDPNRTWHQLTGVLRHLVHLRHMDFGQCPGSMLHAVTDKLKDLEGITAEFITDTMQEPDMWTTNVKLDVGKFAGLEHLEVLKLRGVCGLLLPAFSFSGGLTELSALTHLRTLSLTTLRDVQEEDFSFLASLTQLQELELGDISDWKPETYSQLAKLTELRSVRLECGVDSEEGGLGEAILSLDKLKNLELIKFATSSGLMKNLHKVKSLNSFSIWPDTEKRAAHVNTYTLRAVSHMTSLRQLDWGIMIDQSATGAMEDSQDSNSSSGDGKNKDGIPILPENFDLELKDQTTEDIDGATQYVSVQELVDKIGDFLPDTKIRVFKVPIISASKS